MAAAVGFSLLKRGSSSTKPRYVVGIDLGATNAKAGVIDETGKLLGSASAPLTAWDPESVVESLVKCTQSAVAQAGINWEEVAGGKTISLEQLSSY